MEAQLWQQDKSLVVKYGRGIRTPFFLRESGHFSLPGSVTEPLLCYPFAGWLLAFLN